MNEQERDPLFGTKAVAVTPSRSKALQDATRLTLNLTQETAKNLYDTLGGLLANDRGVKIDIHYGTKTTETTSFASAFFFLKAIQERAAYQSGGASFQKKPATTSKASAEAAANEIKKLG